MDKSRFNKSFPADHFNCSLQLVFLYNPRKHPATANNMFSLTGPSAACFQVILKATSIGKPFGAMWAGESISTIVRVEVRLEAFLICKLLGTHGALKDLGVGVHLQVELEAGHIGEGLVADRAHKGFGVVVHVHVPHIVTPRHEAFGTDAAPVLGQVLVVLTLMVRQPRARLELCVTHVALEDNVSHLILHRPT